MGLNARAARRITPFHFAGINQNLITSKCRVSSAQPRDRCEYHKHTIALPSVRTAKQFYPIAPRELKDFFLEENLYFLAKDAQESSRAQDHPRHEVRDYLRHTLDYGLLRDELAHHPRAASDVCLRSPIEDFMHRALEALHERDSARVASRRKPQTANSFTTTLDTTGSKGPRQYQGQANRRSLLGHRRRCGAPRFVSQERCPEGFLGQGPALRAVSKRPLPLPQSHPQRRRPSRIFCDYVQNRWPIISFALDPVTDQQNIADSFNLKRDLQLALSFAFATGQINFSQLNTFRRQIQQSADTIALNRTVTGFVHGNDIFGFRFTPRFQNPPNQRTNIGVIASQFISGAARPRTTRPASRNSSAGIRELTAVLLIPTFLPTDADERRRQLVQAQRSRAPGLSHEPDDGARPSRPGASQAASPMRATPTSIATTTSAS